jgi:hypothetical protein
VKLTVEVPSVAYREGAMGVTCGTSPARASTRSTNASSRAVELKAVSFE